MKLIPKVSRIGLMCIVLLALCLPPVFAAQNAKGSYTYLNVSDKTSYYADGLLVLPCTGVVGVNWRI